MIDHSRECGNLVIGSPAQHSRNAELQRVSGIVHSMRRLVLNVLYLFHLGLREDSYDSGTPRMQQQSVSVTVSCVLSLHLMALMIPCMQLGGSFIQMYTPVLVVAAVFPMTYVVLLRPALHFSRLSSRYRWIDNLSRVAARRMVRALICSAGVSWMIVAAIKLSAWFLNSR